MSSPPVIIGQCLFVAASLIAVFGSTSAEARLYLTLYTMWTGASWHAGPTFSIAFVVQRVLEAYIILCTLLFQHLSVVPFVAAAIVFLRDARWVARCDGRPPVDVASDLVVFAFLAYMLSGFGRNYDLL